MYKYNAAVWLGEQWQTGSSKQGFCWDLLRIVDLLSSPFLQSQPNRVDIASTFCIKCLTSKQFMYMLNKLFPRV